MLEIKKNNHSGQVHIALGDTLKHEAEGILKDMGLTITEAVRVFLRQVVKERELPFLVHYSAKTPNKETIEAMKELESGGGEIITLKELKKTWKTNSC